MTRRALPKPVEAWASVTLDGESFILGWDDSDNDAHAYLLTTEESDAYGPQIRVRIVPIPEKTKKRTKRKEKK